MTKVYDLIDALESSSTDPRTRRYITAKRVLYKQGGVSNAEHMLKDIPNQAIFHPQADCWMENKPGQPNAAVLLDFGTEFAGCLRLMVRGVRNEGNKHVSLRVRLGESAMEALAPLGTKNTTNDHANRDMVIDVCGMSANETNESGFRFAYIELLTENAGISFYGVKGVFCFRDLEYKGSFECNDERLNKIWQVAAYTVHLNMQEFLWDGIKRDRLVWIGDMHTEVQTILTVFGDQNIIRESLDLTRDDTPVEIWMNNIPTYSLWWLFIHHDLMRQVGDIEYLKEQKEYMVALVKRILCLVKENGSEDLPEHRFLDWPNNADPVAKHAGLHAILKMTFDRCAEMLDVLDEHELAEQCRERSALMCKHIPDPGKSKQAAAALSRSIADGDMVKEYVALVHGAPPPEGDWEDLLFKDSRKNKVFVVKRQRAGVKAARLTYRLVKAGAQSLVHIRLYTGRSHQIRVQFSSRGFPLVGDHKYGSRDDRKEPMLFSQRISFPYQGQEYVFEAEPEWSVEA